MAKNIVIFSDGTGQAGGIEFDEVRTNVYKLFRASRVGPDTTIDPSEQVAFYDPGLGSAADGGHLKIGWARTIYNWVSMVTGLGITANIIDCYAALIRLYRPGDRIFLIGFSRGAYTVRSLAGVISLCGIPRQLPDAPLPLDVKGSRQLASKAVKQVYQFCSSYDKSEIGRYRRFMLDTRDAIGDQFRNAHGCTAANETENTKANVYPYFIGVFDTVAALGHTGLGFAVTAAVIALMFLIPYAVSWMPALPVLSSFLPAVSFWQAFWIVSPVLALGAAAAYLANYLKWAPSLPGYGPLKRLTTIHFAQPKHKFNDYVLNVNVGYAKHAISIDENRADFKRVPWAPTEEKQDKRDAEGNLYFEQVWFSGVHADVGGGYDENGSRLSDISLNWMLAAASVVPNGLQHDPCVLRLHPDPTGGQHDEQKGRFLKFGARKLPGTKAIIHKSVYARFDAGPVVLFDAEGAYLPRNMNEHVDFIQYFDGTTNPKPANPAAAKADDVEERWARQRTATPTVPVQQGPTA